MPSARRLFASSLRRAIALLLAGAVGAPTWSFAEQSCEETTAVDFQVLKKGTEEGNWLSKKDANRVFFVLSECLPRYRHLVDSQGRLIDLQARTIRTSSAALVLAESIHQDERERGDAWKTDALENRRALKEEREAANSWTRSPVLWFAIGGVVVGGIVIGTAYALEGAR